MIVNVTAYPYAVQYGHIEIPDGVEDIRQYIVDNWIDIVFGEPELDHEGIDFEAEVEE